MKILNYYKTLGLNRENSNEELYDVCKKLYLQYHPETTKGLTSLRMFVLVNDAYGIILNEKNRMIYDFILSKYEHERALDKDDREKISIIKSVIHKRRSEIKDYIRDKQNDDFNSQEDFILKKDIHQTVEENTDFDFDFDFDINIGDFLDLS